MSEVSHRDLRLARLVAGTYRHLVLLLALQLLLIGFVLAIEPRVLGWLHDFASELWAVAPPSPFSNRPALTELQDFASELWAVATLRWLPVLLPTFGIAGLVALLSWASAVAAGALMTLKAYRLAKAIGLAIPLAWALGMFLPVISLVLLAVLKAKAAAFCRQHEVTVGFLRPKEKQPT